MRAIRLYGFLLYLMTCLFMVRCNNKPGNTSTSPTDTIPSRPQASQDESIPGGFSTQVALKFDSSALANFITRHSVFRAYERDMKSFYTLRNYAYAWFDDNGLIPQASNLYNRIINIADEGLPNNLPYRDTFAIMMDSLLSLEHEKPDTEIELILTAQYFAYAKVAWQGLSEKESKSVDWHLPRRKTNMVQLMDSLLNPNRPAGTREPVYRQYSLLKPYLKKYRDIEKEGGWKEIKPDRKKYEKGDSSAVIGLIRQRLFLLGDIGINNNSSVYDDSLVNGIKLFQKRLGLKEDGIIGVNFFKEINYPISKRIEQIIVNMERCRWLPEIPDREYLAVNIPEFALHAYSGDSLLWSMDVIVGKSIHETAIFSGQLKHVVFSPYWNIPPGIMKNEVLPAIRRNPNYVKSHNMEWVGNSLRQKPGPANPLGKVKFLFPNSYNIYLHDTPSKGLFEQDKRTFSHGCIRVSRAKDLAKWLLRDYQEWTDEKITTAMNAGKEQYFTLRETVPVFIAYFTAWVDRQGRINFRDDVYKRDDRLAKMIWSNE
jgi:murein L,D-transpeptidase YcbB/YkuD